MNFEHFDNNATNNNVHHAQVTIQNVYRIKYINKIRRFPAGYIKEFWENFQWKTFQITCISLCSNACYSVWKKFFPRSTSIYYILFYFNHLWYIAVTWFMHNTFHYRYVYPSNNLYLRYICIRCWEGYTIILYRKWLAFRDSWGRYHIVI